jgi:hypothetical protein
MTYRLANGAWCLLLLYATAVQVNDPDPLRWVLAYGAGAGFCAVAAFTGAVPIRPTLAWAACCAGVAVVNAIWGVGVPEMGWGVLRDEIARETLGLSLMTAWMLGLALWTRARAVRAGVEP